MTGTHPQMTGRILRYALFCICLFLPARARSQQQPELIVEIDRQRVYLGESLIYDVTVNHVENPSEPTLEGFDDFGVELLGQRSLNSQQITIINGVRNEVIRRGRLFQYRLTPAVAGTLTIPAPTAEIAGSTIRGRSVAIEVIAPEKQDLVFLEVTADRDTVYPMQPLTVTLTLAVRQLPGDLASRSPLSVQSRDPAKLTAPFLDDQQIPDGLNPTQTWRQILEPLITSSRRGTSDGVEINNIGGGLFSSRYAVFRPQSTIQQRPTLTGDEAGYFVYQLQRQFVPQKIGTCVFPACNIKGTFATGFVGGSLDGQQVYAVSQPLRVTVRDVPLEGRPDSYIGGVGVFDVTADVSPTTATVGDPITLSLTVHGQGTISDLRAPDIAALPDMENEFRVYEATEETVGNGKVFTWSLRPLTESVTAFPAIPVSYFDVDREEYVSLESEAIPLTISAAQQLAASEIVSVPGAATPSSQQGLEISDAGLFANYSGLQMLRADTTALQDWVPVWLTILMAYAGATVVIRRHQRLHADPSILRRRGARARAREALQTLVVAAGNESSVTPDALARVVAGLIADYTDKTEAGMTAADAQQILLANGVESSLIRRTQEFMQECDAARYGGNANSKSLYTECRVLLDELAGELNQRC